MLYVRGSFCAFCPFVKAVTEAVASLRPVALRVGRSQVHRWLKNSLHPDIVDRELNVLQASTPRGNAVFTLVDLGCHPEVMFGENGAISQMNSSTHAPP